MKKKILLLIAIVASIVVLSTMLFACSTSNTLSGKDWDKLQKYQDGVLKDVRKCEPTLNSLMSALKDRKFVATFEYTRYYYSNSNDTIAFLGSDAHAGYNYDEEQANKANKEPENKWMIEYVDYTFVYNKGDYKITAKVYDPIVAEGKDKSKKLKGTYVLTCKDGQEVVDDSSYEAYIYCKSYIYDIIFGKFTDKEFLEAQAISAVNGNRLYTNMMQYQTVCAYKFDTNGMVDYSSPISYKENKDKTKYSLLEERQSGNTLAFSLNGKDVDIKGDDVTYWDSYGEDITYNLYKVAAVYNDRITLTYKKKDSRIQTFGYYGEVVLPFYTRKSKFKTYNVRKCTVADYFYFTAEFDYDANAEI